MNTGVQQPLPKVGQWYLEGDKPRQCKGYLNEGSLIIEKEPGKVKAIAYGNTLSDLTAIERLRLVK